jgi:hypothetical protein
MAAHLVCAEPEARYRQRGSWWSERREKRACHAPTTCIRAWMRPETAARKPGCYRRVGGVLTRQTPETCIACAGHRIRSPDGEGIPEAAAEAGLTLRLKQSVAVAC